MYPNVYGNCEKCGADLEAIDVVGYYDGRHLCSKCRALEPLTGIAATSIQLPNCEICGAPVDSYLFLTTGQRRCKVCQGLGFVGVPTATSNISSTLSGLETGVFDAGKVGIVDPRDEQIAKLEAKIEELERTGYEDKEELNNLRQRLVAVEKKVPTPRDRKVVNPSFQKLCQVLELWFPRRVRRYEESYKAELTEHLSHTFLHVREEAEGGLCDILVAKRHPIHLKVNPEKGQYDTLCGQILRTLSEFKHVACIIIGISSSELYHDFMDMIRASAGASKVRFFPKGR